MGDWGQRTEGSRQRTEGRKLLTVGFRYRLTEGDIWRGWIVPVGGSTPDRLRNYCWFPLSFDGGEIFGGGGSFRSGMQSPTGSGTTVGFCCRLTEGDIWRGWIVPVGGSTPDRLRNYCWFPLSFDGGEIFGGGGSFRSGVQPPTGSERGGIFEFG